jgi:hypothetical protein
MARTTIKELEQLVTVANNTIGGGGLEIEYAYGRPRVVSNNGSTDVSPRLAPGELKLWLHAFIDGLSYRQRHTHNPTHAQRRRRRNNPEGGGWRSYGPGKFDSMVDSFIFQAGLDGLDEETGDVQGPGWFGLAVGNILKMAEDGAKEQDDELTPDERDELADTAAVILSESDQGFVSVEYFDTAAEAREKWKEIEEEVSGFFDEDEDGG